MKNVGEVKQNAGRKEEEGKPVERYSFFFLKKEKSLSDPTEVLP